MGLDVLQRLQALVGRQPLVVQPVHRPAHRPVLFQEALAQGLRGVRREDEGYLLVAQGVIDLFRGGRARRDEAFEGPVGGENEIDEAIESL